MIASLAVANRPDEPQLRPRRLQGRQRVQGLRRPAAHRRHGHRPRRPPRRAGPHESWGPSSRSASTGSPTPARRTSRTTPSCRRASPHRAPMPRLLIVIDEFASMARELPDFVTGLVSIAQRGRSLGIHLLLATQRPSGVVSPEIRANTNLRIALRVTDAADSSDVIETPDAARIPKSAPGRGYARLGHGALVALPGRPGRRTAARACARPAAPEPFVAPVAWTQLGYAAPQAPVRERRRRRRAHRPVRARRRPARGRRRRARARAAQPLAAGAARAGPAPRPRRRGPGRSRRRPAACCPSGCRTCRPCSASRSRGFDPAARRPPAGHRGRPQRPVPAAADPGRVRGRALLDRRRAPVRHRLRQRRAAGPARTCRTAAPSSPARQVERATRLLGRLQERGRAPAGACWPSRGFADITEQRRAVRRPPSGCRTCCCCSTAGRASPPRSARSTAAASATSCSTLLREGASVGVHVVITGDRSLASGRISSLTDNKLVLRLADQGDYGFVGLNPRTCPSRSPPAAPSPRATARRPRSRCWRRRSPARRRRRSSATSREAASARDALPSPGRCARSASTSCPAASASTRPGRCGPTRRRPAVALVGVGGDELTAVGPDLVHGVGLRRRRSAEERPQHAADGHGRRRCCDGGAAGAPRRPAAVAAARPRRAPRRRRPVHRPRCVRAGVGGGSRLGGRRPRGAC